MISALSYKCSTIPSVSLKSLADSIRPSSSTDRPCIGEFSAVGCSLAILFSELPTAVDNIKRGMLIGESIKIISSVVSLRSIPTISQLQDPDFLDTVFKIMADRGEYRVISLAMISDIYRLSQPNIDSLLRKDFILAVAKECFGSDFSRFPIAYASLTHIASYDPICTDIMISSGAADAINSYFSKYFSAKDSEGPTDLVIILTRSNSKFFLEQIAQSYEKLLDLTLSQYTGPRIAATFAIDALISCKDFSEKIDLMSTLSILFASQQLNCLKQGNPLYSALLQLYNCGLEDEFAPEKMDGINNDFYHSLSCFLECQSGPYWEFAFVLINQMMKRYWYAFYDWKIVERLFEIAEGANVSCRISAAECIFEFFTACSTDILSTIEVDFFSFFREFAPTIAADRLHAAIEAFSKLKAAGIKRELAEDKENKDILEALLLESNQETSRMIENLLIELS